MMPVPKREFIRLDIERAVSRMQAVVELGRVMRDRRNVPIKYPLPELVLIHQDPEYLKDVLSLEAFILGELNVRVLTPSSDKLKYGVTVRAEPDHKVLGQRLKNDFKQITQLIKKLTDSEIQQQLARGHFEIGGHRIETSEIRIIIQFEAGENDGLSQRYEAHSDNDVLVLMDMTPNQELQEEGMAREIINRVQKLKKKAKLIPTDPVLIYFKIGNDSNDVLKVAHSHRQFIETIIKSPFLDDCAEAQSKAVLIEETQELKGAQLTIRICSTQVFEKNIHCVWYHFLIMISILFTGANASIWCLGKCGAIGRQLTGSLCATTTNASPSPSRIHPTATSINRRLDNFGRTASRSNPAIRTACKTLLTIGRRTEARGSGYSQFEW
jgi:isoleucyl-tRNA synthetase